MIEIGKINKLKVVRDSEFGYYLDGQGRSSSDDILLPTKNAIGEINVEDEVEAFIYRDSKDRLVATMKQPKAVVGQVAYLEVVDKSRIGYFVNIGLERDVLVPFKEITYDLEVGKSYLFSMYEDKTGRIAATTKVDKYLHHTNNYTIGEELEGTIYGMHRNGNIMIALENTYRGLILSKEYFAKVTMGEVLKVRVKKYFDDGKVEVTPRKSRLEEMDSLEDIILNYLKAHDGFMIYNDKSDAEDIKNKFKSSKNTFKRALGGLMKKGLITQDEQGTKLKEKN